MKQLILATITILIISLSPVPADAQVKCPTMVAPVMPKAAIDNKVEGQVKARARIKDGVVIDVAILSGATIFHDAVREAMMQYKCSSTVAEVAVTQVFNFKSAAPDLQLPAIEAKHANHLETKAPEPQSAQPKNSKGGYNQADIKRARALASKGDTNAQLQVGNMYDSGQGVKQDRAEAVKWYRLVADKGNVSAQHRLGEMHRDGLGVAVDFVASRKWFEQASSQGNTDSQVSIAAMYAQGQGVAQSMSGAAEWYRMAAERGNMHGQYELGEMYRSGGGGFFIDNDQALKWFQKAATQGHAKAIAAVDVLRNDMAIRQREVEQQQRNARQDEMLRQQVEQTRRQTELMERQMQQQQQERDRAEIEKKKCLENATERLCYMSCLGVNVNRAGCQNDCRNQERANVAACNGIFIPPAPQPQQIIIQQGGGDPNPFPNMNKCIKDGGTLMCR